ncbi:MAG: pitrilysin family protein [Hyphomonadaceae bacterium]
MKKIVMFVAAALALAACATASSPGGASGGLDVPALQYHYRELPNGLRVYAMPDPNTANVSVQVWYDVGSADDPIDRSGFAHLFEHIMFKSTRNMPSEFFDRLTEDVGGFNNASTYDDFTNYYEVVPANHLQRILWAEADRMSTLVVNEETFASERDVVKEELRQRVLASPYGRLFYFYLNQANFSVHPYGRPGIGSIEDLDAATVDDVRAFHATYYRPDNAVLVVAGNFDLNQFDAWVDQYFAPIARPERPIPRIEAVEPERTSARDYTTYAPNVPLPAVAISYRQPQSTSADIPTLMVIDAILATGESSRLYQSLVYEQQISTAVFTNLEATQDPGAYTLLSIMSEGHSADEGVAALTAQIARLRDASVTAGELDEAKNELIMAALESRETAYGRAFELAESVIRYGDADHADALLQAIQSTTAADVQRVARALFRDDRRVVIRYLPEQPGVSGDTIATAATVQARALSIPQSEIPIYTLAAEGERVAPPEPGAAVDAVIPQTAERTLPNGLRVIVASNRALPLISANLRVISGSSADPQNRAGLANMTTDLLTRGTTTRSATDIARQIESLGADLSAGASADSSVVSLQTRSDRADDAFTVFADVVRNPAFAEDELDRARQQALDGLTVALTEPGSIASFAMTRALYGATPYGGVASPASLTAITQDELARFHTGHWRPDNAVLVIVGDVTAADGFALAERYFGDWPRPQGRAGGAERGRLGRAAAHHRCRPAADRAGSGVGRSARPDAPERGLFPAAGRQQCARRRLLRAPELQIRIRRGLSYGAGSSLSARLAPGRSSCRRKRAMTRRCRCTS